MNVHIFESDPDVERELQGQQVKFHSFPLGRETVQFASEAEVVVVFIGSRLDKEVFVALPRLRYIITRSTGYDHIDIEEAKRRGVVVSNVVGYGTVPVSEHTFALLLGLMRNVKEGDRRVRSGRWQVRGLMGTQISGKTFGVAGTGNIGSRIALLAQAFGARVLAYDAVERQDLKAAGVHYVEWTELLRESDVLSLNLPLNEATRHILDRSAILMMKPGSYLVNTGRGGLIDEEALVEALESHRIAGAALDVFEHEPPSGKLLKLDNVLLTPHVGWYTDGGFHEIMRQTVACLKAFEEGSYLNRVARILFAHILYGKV